MGKALSCGTGGKNLDFITATAGDILSGCVGSDKNGNPVNGAIPIMAGVRNQITTKNQEITIASGYRNSDGLVKIDPDAVVNLTGGNIRSGVPILGVYGTMPGHFVPHVLNNVSQNTVTVYDNQGVSHSVKTADLIYGDDDISRNKYYLNGFVAKQDSNSLYGTILNLTPYDSGNYHEIMVLNIGPSSWTSYTINVDDSRNNQIGFRPAADGQWIFRIPVSTSFTSGDLPPIRNLFAGWATEA